MESLALNFTFELFLKKEDKFEQLQGFRKNLVEFGSSILQYLDTGNHVESDLPEIIENQLNAFFEGKKVTIEYSKRKKEKFIHKIKQITKT